MENYSQELNDTLNEAMNVRIELESIMENAIYLSQTIVNKYEKKISPTSEMTTKPEIITLPAVSKTTQEEIRIATIANIKPAEAIVDNEELTKPNTIRIYELAKDLQMTSKELITIIKSLGIKVSSHMNALDDRQVSLIRQAIDTGLSTKPDERMIETVPIICQDFDQSVTEGSGMDLFIENESLINENEADFSSNGDEFRPLEEEPLQGLEFSIDELKKAHPYIAVKTMYDNGYPIIEIAKLLSRGQGEVSLILNLAKKKTAVV